VGYARKLKKIAEDKGYTIMSLAKNCNIPPTTLYSSIKNDSDIRLDYAILLADFLEISVNELFDYSSAKKIEVRAEPKLEDKDIIIIENLVKEFYVLDDEARQEVLDFIKIKHKFHDDKNRLRKIISVSE
jgi:DNA-binding XRE family transcriptional regulator